jgi:hypothetical protein
VVLSLIYGTKKYAQSKVGTVTFDTMVTEEHRYSSRVTNYPVESGTIISDHIINEPDTVILSGLVTDTPLNILAGFNRSIAAFNALIQIHERRQVIDIVTGIKVYKNMAITSLDVPRSIKNGQSLTFNIQLQKIIFDDNVQVLLDQGNVAGGIKDNTPRAIVAENTDIPLINLDPPFSLKDQASESVNVGVQSLNSIPTAILPNIITNLAAIRGVIV